MFLRYRPPPYLSFPIEIKRVDPPTPVNKRPVSSSLPDDVLSPGDLVGEGYTIQGEFIVPISRPSHSPNSPLQEFEVVKTIETGTYAVVYLVREVLSRPIPSVEGLLLLMGSMDIDADPNPDPAVTVEYGRHYVIKCLSKADLDDDARAAQLVEVTTHQSLQPHPNIATLHRAFESRSFLLLLLEYVPGQDLYYFLQQSQVHPSPSPRPSTPPSPSLLSSLHPTQILSHARLRLVSSMFCQMCDAVAACHDQGVFHRDIKPENFIVSEAFGQDGEREVVVKLIDFGLATREVDSSEINLGSVPYMSYECRNSEHATYRSRAADIWSLGIVLINMLYHDNPWPSPTTSPPTPTNPTPTPTPFSAYLSNPISFLTQTFPGLPTSVASFLATRVFCLLPNPADDAPRISARELGMWARDLPLLIGGAGSGSGVDGGVLLEGRKNSGEGSDETVSVPVVLEEEEERERSRERSAKRRKRGKKGKGNRAPVVADDLAREAAASGSTTATVKKSGRRMWPMWGSRLEDVVPSQSTQPTPPPPPLLTPIPPRAPTISETERSRAAIPIPIPPTSKDARFWGLPFGGGPGGGHTTAGRTREAPMATRAVDVKRHHAANVYGGEYDGGSAFDPRSSTATLTPSSSSRTSSSRRTSTASMVSVADVGSVVHQQNRQPVGSIQIYTDEGPSSHRAHRGAQSPGFADVLPRLSSPTTSTSPRSYHNRRSPGGMPSSASSLQSWRSSSTSAFSRRSNSSLGSVSTLATTVLDGPSALGKAPDLSGWRSASASTRCSNSSLGSVGTLGTSVGDGSSALGMAPDLSSWRSASAFSRRSNSSLASVSTLGTTVGDGSSALGMAPDSSASSLRPRKGVDGYAETETRGRDTQTRTTPTRTPTTRPNPPPRKPPREQVRAMFGVLGPVTYGAPSSNVRLGRKEAAAGSGLEER